MKKKEKLCKNVENNMVGNINIDDFKMSVIEDNIIKRKINIRRKCRITEKDKIYENNKLCKICKGRCCKTIPGIAAPIDFGKTKKEIFENLKKSFLTDKWAIDCYEGECFRNGGKDIYYVRPRVKGIIQLQDLSWGGECIFLQNDGCELNIENRPLECRLLEPNKNECLNHSGDKFDNASMWLKYQDIIRKAAEEYERRI